jgi:hypothetical protein
MSPWMQAGIGIGVGYLLYTYVLKGRVIVPNGSVLSGDIEHNGYKRSGRKAWKSRTAMRVEEREAMHARAPGCFLKPKEMKYPVCSKGGSKPTCEGLLAARRRAILNRDRKVRRKAESMALTMGCGWALRSEKLVV